MFGWYTLSDGFTKSKTQAPKFDSLEKARQFALTREFSCFILDAKSKKTVDELWLLVGGKKQFTSTMK
jgi:hypothetical protein